MFSEVPRVDIRKTMQLTPPLVPNTFLTPIVSILNPHTVFMGVISRRNPFLASHVLMIERARMMEDGAFMRWWRFGLSDDTLR